MSMSQTFKASFDSKVPSHFAHILDFEQFLFLAQLTPQHLDILLLGYHGASIEPDGAAGSYKIVQGKTITTFY